MQIKYEIPSTINEKKRGSFLSWMDKKIQIILLLPALFLMMVVFLYPVLYTIYLSFHDWTFLTLKNPPFVGFRNIINVFKDAGFYKSMLLSGIYVGAGVMIQFFLGFTLALAVNRITVGHGLATTLLVFPMMVTPVVVGLIWKFIFDYNFGIFNYVLTLIGMDKVAMLNSSALALPSTILVDVWQWTGFMFIVLLAGVKSLPEEPFEAAQMDGANVWQTLWNVTIPLLKPIIIVALIMRIAGSIKVFDQIFVLTGGGPGTSTETISILLHRKAFADFDFGYASALAIVLTVIVGIVCWFAIRVLYSDK
ncbi:carbohydrate ABC transporter permease [Neobacillus sp. NPDC097160]|uniref:carbohydrate ABC transporter permease n=1 Tax=Neobacillus sp. NPDC097160 TaxID=3364298 RepID=UPI003806C358